MAVFVFLVLALLGLATWILDVWIIVAGASLILSAIAVVRAGNGGGDIVTREPRT
jgi:hypothetical protein